MEQRFCLLGLLIFNFFFSPSLLSARPTTPIHKYIRNIQVPENESGIEGIDAIYVINLDTRPEKWKRVSALFKERDLKVNRVSAVNGYILSEDEKKELSGPYPVQLRGTQIGCLLSHLSIVHDAWKRGFSTIWVMEDDVEFMDDIHLIPERLQTLTASDHEWDIFYTDVDWRKPDGSYLISNYYNPRPDQSINLTEYNQERKPLSDDIMRIQKRWGTHSMIISRSGMKKIIDYYSTYHLWTPIDADLHYIPNIREYSARHEIVTNWNKSPISDINGSQKKEVALISSWAIQASPFLFTLASRDYNVHCFSMHDCETNSLPQPSKYDKIILFNPYLSDKDRSSFPKEKTILFVWEPETLPKAFYDCYQYVYTWDDSLVDNKKFFKFYYPEKQAIAHDLPNFSEKKLCVMISSHFTLHRLEMLDFFRDKKDEFEFYGKKCPEKQFEHLYKGPIEGPPSSPEKINTLKKYRFCLCFENKTNLPGYISEKIFHCFAAGCVPVYLGASNIELYIPKNCFIDLRDFESRDALYSYIKNMSQEKYEEYLSHIRRYLESTQSSLFSVERFNEIFYEALNM